MMSLSAREPIPPKILVKLVAFQRSAEAKNRFADTLAKVKYAAAAAKIAAE